MTIRFDGRVAIVTGAGNGLGRSHALALAARGAKVVVNDLGGARDGTGASSEAARAVVAEIKAAGGEAIANGANVADFAQVQAMVKETMDAWGRVDILINNAGILRDKSFSKMDMADFKLVMDVHLMGAAYCAKAVWEIMKEQNYGRIVMTSSSSGLYGNFGQSNYSAAKLAVVGLMNSLAQEGEKYNVRVNSLAPAALTRMTEDIIPDPRAAAVMQPEPVSAGVLVLCSEDAPNKFILCAGAGGYASAHLYETRGLYLAEQTPEAVQEHWAQIDDPKGEERLSGALKQTEKFIGYALAAQKSS
ncbi:MAG TPA: SDR family NAD(P)-dependent oxidoreductase [Porticoccaceae bacterium]|nr:SDR family NAD(P)-dependent oxidoreductase [Porticoccaceae bacterium]